MKYFIKIEPQIFQHIAYPPFFHHKSFFAFIPFCTAICFIIHPLSIYYKLLSKNIADYHNEYNFPILFLYSHIRVFYVDKLWITFFIFSFIGVFRRGFSFFY